ncbi:MULTISPECIES: hypothetical protein [Butyricimonas]|jgi:hypothetical protein|uniref:Penicillin-binding protein activator LpoB n=2 Tax=Butyricimonas faecihominis TaxID=1472416 RepID=A0A7W6HZ56_9BACT|nr:MULTISPECIES: hypothetical protein [Butyricimonas]KAB1505522.1 hypothetical protein F8R21_13465 [Butyricimonas faecihominis]MBB4027684.1 hypothetical protein [Butyricimonas faecihominis]MBS6686761.1 hypothetical protein [Sanguibacteroides justesenii]WOF07221.1 hypothetical protein F1611_01770 [Butyricimonas faecihominis]
MLKRIITIMALLCVAVIAVKAQEVKKPRMYVEYFTEADGVEEANSDKVRQAVMAALNKTKRFELVDQDAEYSMKKEEERRTDEKAMSDEKSRTQTITAAGHDYILGGNVLACSVKSEQKDGKTMYSCVLNYSVTVTEVATSTTVASATFDHSPSGIGGTVGKLLDLSDSKDKAIASAVNMIASDIENFLIKEFPLESTIVPMDYEVKKDKLVKCYINLGSDHGVKKGDYFSVLAPSVRAGRTTYSEIGKMKVEEVVDGTMSQCKVVQGDKKIFTAMEAFQALDEAAQKQQPLKVKATIAPLFSL